MATPGNRMNEAGKTDSQCSALHDNVPTHTSQVAMAAATECGFEILSHPPYSPDMAPGERSGSVVECLTRYQGARSSSLTSVTALCP